MSAPSKNLTLTMYRELLRGSERHHASCDQATSVVAHVRGRPRVALAASARVHVALPPRRDLRASPQQRLSTAPRACLS